MESIIVELEGRLLKKKFPKDIRIFLPSETNFIYVNNGHATQSMSIYGIMSNIKGDRGSVLDALVKFEFMIFEMLRFSVIGFEPTPMVLEVVKALSPKQRINVLTSKKILKKEIGKKLHRIVDLRNQIAHKFQASESIWNEKPLFDRNNFHEFQKELQKTWNELIEEYNKMISKSDVKGIIKKIDEYDSKLKKK